MKRISKFFMVCFAFVLVTYMLLMPVQAANNACVLVNGDAKNCNKWYTITLETGKNWGSNKITFAQTKGAMKYGAGMVTDKTYGAYTIKVTDQSTKKQLSITGNTKKNTLLN